MLKHELRWICFSSCSNTLCKSSARSDLPQRSPPFYPKPAILTPAQLAPKICSGRASTVTSKTRERQCWKGSVALLLQCPGADRKAPSPGSNGREAEVAWIRKQMLMTLGGEDLTAPFSHALYLFRQDPQRSICIGKRNSQRECTGHHLILAGNSSHQKDRSPARQPKKAWD